MDNPVEELTPDLYRELLHEGQVIIFTLHTSRRQTLDAWAAAIAEALDKHDAAKPYLSVLDLSDKSIAITPYARQRTMEVGQLHPEIHGRTAIVVSHTLMAQVMRGLLHLLGSRTYGRERKIFFRREEAIRWVEELLKPPTNPAVDR